MKAQAFTALLRAALGTILLVLVSVAPQTAAMGAKALPRPPCQSDNPEPDFAAPGPHPRIEVWFEGELPDGWSLPSCLDWEQQATDVLIVTAGRFAEPGGIDAVAARIASVSSFTRMLYWSASRQVWRPLVNEAFALSGPHEEQRRRDFSSDELKAGTLLHFWQDENSPADSLVYRLRVRDRTQDRLILTLENAHAINFMLMPLFEPGAYQSIIYVTRENGQLWRYYSLQRAAIGVSVSTREHRSSYINRAAALFRYVAGIPTDSEPPLALQ